MTKKEENHQSSNTSFKLRLIKKKPEAVWMKARGIYQQLNDKQKYEFQKLDMTTMEQAIQDLLKIKYKK